VGIWRLIDSLDRHGIRALLAEIAEHFSGPAG
jgi:hypothetical protein